MPYRSLTALLFAASMAVTTHAAGAAQPDGPDGRVEVIARCASPEGLGRYFRGDIVSGEAVRPASTGNRAQHLTLVRRGETYDLLHTDGEVVRSVRAHGSDIRAMVAEGGAIHHLMVEQDGYLDHFVFQAEEGSAGKVVWATQRITRDESGITSSAPCDGK